MPAITLHRSARQIAILTINRPAKRNALALAQQEAFAATVEALITRPPRVLIIIGRGPVFVAGGDLTELAGQPTTAVGHQLQTVMSRALVDLTALPCPVIGAANGDAAGGGIEILSACDLRIASTAARFHFAQIRQGLTTDWGGAGRLVCLIGLSRTLDLLLSGRVISAAEAQAIGFVHRLAPAGEAVLPAAQAWAEALVALPADALAALKKLLWQGVGTYLDSMAAAETTAFQSLFGRPDHLEALAAFGEKRPPQFNSE